MTKDQRLYCRDILDRIRRIENHTVARWDAFLESELLQDGVIRSFEVIGEVIKRLDPVLTARYPRQLHYHQRRDDQQPVYCADRSYYTDAGGNISNT